MDSEGCLDIAQVVLKSVGQHVIAPVSAVGVAVPGVMTDAMQREHPHGLGQGRPMGGDHASFTRREVFRGIETERYCIAGGRGFRTDRPTLITCYGRVRSVVEHMTAYVLGIGR